MFEKLEEYIKEYNLRHKDEGGCIMKRYSAEHIEPPTDDEESVGGVDLADQMVSYYSKTSCHVLKW